jgi:hypothetical protein
MIGSAPALYAPNVIGFPAGPEDGTVNCSRQVQPFLKRIESPATNEPALTCAIVLNAQCEPVSAWVVPSPPVSAAVLT